MMMNQAIHEKAIAAAKAACNEYLEQNPDNWFPCGFAWVVADVKGNTKAGKAFKACGFDKYYYGGLDLWDPAKAGTQVMYAKFAGAQAYAEVVNEALGERVVRADCRMD